VEAALINAAEALAARGRRGAYRKVPCAARADRQAIARATAQRGYGVMRSARNLYAQRWRRGKRRGGNDRRQARRRRQAISPPADKKARRRKAAGNHPINVKSTDPCYSARAARSTRAADRPAMMRAARLRGCARCAGSWRGAPPQRYERRRCNQRGATARYAKDAAARCWQNQALRAKVRCG